VPHPSLQTPSWLQAARLGHGQAQLPRPAGGVGCIVDSEDHIVNCSVSIGVGTAGEPSARLQFLFQAHIQLRPGGGGGREARLKGDPSRQAAALA